MNKPTSIVLGGCLWGAIIFTGLVLSGPAAASPLALFGELCLVFVVMLILYSTKRDW